MKRVRTDEYGWARLCQVIGNYFKGNLSLGIETLDNLPAAEDCDNGMYIIENWEEEIAKRICELAYGDNTDLEEYNEIEKAIYYLKCVAENEYNSDYFRICYKTLEKI